MILNSGRPVGDEKMARNQESTLDGLIERVRLRVSTETHVSAAWVVGSLGRNESDPLSDIDLVLSASNEAIAALLDRLPTLIASVGPVALIHPAPANAPMGGGQFNVLYDVSPLPVYVDWSVWPLQRRRPTDAQVLFERDPSQFETRGSFDAILADLPKGESSGTQEDVDFFRVFMTPIIAKEAARGWTESVEVMMKYIHVPSHQMTTFSSAVARLRQIVADYGRKQPEIATSCVKRYLMQIELLMTSDEGVA